jgi:protein FAM32A
MFVSTSKYGYCILLQDILTAAQKRYLKVMEDRSEEKAKGAVQLTHRMKVEKYSAMLASLSEHNDIPRISAAGNG